MEDISRLQGYSMPGEFAPHEGCVMIWPVRPGSWPNGGVAAQRAFCQVAAAIAESEPVYLLADGEHLSQAKAAAPEGVQVLCIDSDDAWARDVAPTFVINGKGDIQGINWRFNAWGGQVDGLYAQWDKDDLVAPRLCQALSIPCFDAHPFVLEGGSIHSDGQGTILTTEACLLSPGRNPGLSCRQIEQVLLSTLGAKKVVWLPCGIYEDETNEHVDNICAFVGPAEVVLAWCDDPADPQYAMSRACEAALARQTDALGRSFTIHRLPVPQRPVTVAPEEVYGYTFAPGEEQRQAGDRLAASYVNFYIANKAVIVPQFGDVHDSLALEILAPLFPGRAIRPIAAREILLGGGNIHCITQQIPRRMP